MFHLLELKGPSYEICANTDISHQEDNVVTIKVKGRRKATIMGRILYSNENEKVLRNLRRDLQGICKIKLTASKLSPNSSNAVGAPLQGDLATCMLDQITVPRGEYVDGPLSQIELAMLEKPDNYVIELSNDALVKKYGVISESQQPITDETDGHLPVNSPVPRPITHCRRVLFTDDEGDDRELSRNLSYGADIEEGFYELTDNGSLRRSSELVEPRSKYAPNREEEKTSRVDCSGTVAPPQKRKKTAKHHSCYFCAGVYTNIRKHWSRKHRDEPLLQAALEEANKCGKKHHKAFGTLRKMGDAKFAERKSKSVRCIVARSSETTSPSKYLICTACKGYYVPKNYARHRRVHCPLRSQEKGTSIIGAARVATKNVAPEAHPLLVKHVFPYLRNERQRDIILTDPVAIVLGNILCDEQLSKPEPADLYKYVTNQLRLLADILLIANEMDPEIKEIDDLFHAHRYETLIKSIKKRGGFQHGLYEHPYPAMQSCIILSKLCRRLKSIALTLSKEEDYSRYERMDTLLREQQNTNVTKTAGAAVIAHRREKVEILPATSEVKQLFEALSGECRDALEAAKNEFSVARYAALAKAILARIMVINRRRPGDVHKTTISEFKNLTKADDSFLATLSEGPDRERAADLRRFVTKGKLNKILANLLTTDMVEGIEFLIAHRGDVGLPDDNVYVFANPKAKRAPFYRADDALKYVCEKRGLLYENLMATKLRKHFATTTSNLDQQTQMALSNFMGHSYDIHQNIYQIRQVQTDVSVIGRILYDASGIYHSDQPLTTQLSRGSELSTAKSTPSKPFNITAASSRSSTLTLNAENEDDSDIVPLEELSEANRTTVELAETESFSNKPRPVGGGKVENGSSIKSTKQKTKKHPMKIKMTTGSEKLETGSDKVERTDDQRDTSFNFGLSISECNQVISRKGHPVFTSRTWRTPQKTLARKIFHEYLQNQEVPSIHEIQDLLAARRAKLNKSFIQIQSWIRNEIKRNKEVHAGRAVQRWTTPQKNKLRKHFLKYYKTTKKTGRFTYPPENELACAATTIPEFKGKTPNLLRSKLQHEFRQLAIIGENLEEEYTEDEKSETEESEYISSSETD